MYDRVLVRPLNYQQYCSGFSLIQNVNSAGINLFKVNNTDFRTMYRISPKLTMETL